MIDNINTSSDLGQNNNSNFQTQVSKEELLQEADNWA
jgi:hypothetical protein